MVSATEVVWWRLMLGALDLLGILSLMFWSLFMVVTVKYLTFVMRADHNGEGGIFALLVSVPERFRTRAFKDR